MNMDVAPPAYQSIGKLIATGDLAQAGMATLAGLINTVPYEPKYLYNRGTYHYESALTPTIELEFDGQVITVIQSTAPGTAPTPTSLRPRTVKPVTAVRIAEQFPVLASEIAAIRELGGVDLDSVETRADRLLRVAIRNIRSTLEYHRLGAAMGLWLDADGTVIQNYFTLLGVSQPTYDVTFSTAATSKWIGICADLKNALEDALGNLDGDDEFEPVVLCGRTFWKKFVTQPDVVTAFQYFESEQQRRAGGYDPLRDDLRYADFKYGGFRWRQYRGAANNTGRFMPDNEAHLIVDMVPGTYLGFWTPPKDNKFFTNMPGVPIVPSVKELDHGEGLEFRLQSNPIHVMTRPLAAYKLYSSN